MTTTAYATQVLELAEQVSTRTAILDRGRLVAAGALEERQRRARAERSRSAKSAPVSSAATAKALLERRT